MMYRTLHALSVLLLVLLIATEYSDKTPEWKDYQSRYKELLANKALNSKDLDEAHSLKVQIRQVLAKDLTLIDRCQTCHLGVEDPSLVDAPQPFAGHPDIPSHSFDRFGCLPCHQGQPWGTTKDGAHGHVEFWEKPLLGRPYLEAACGRCHEETEVVGAPMLSHGRELMKSLRCEECHKIRGLGGNTGPELSFVGSKHKVPYLRESITNPKANDSNSVMPDFGLSKSDVQAVVVALLALTEKTLPSDLYPKPGDEERIYFSKRVTDSLPTGGKLFGMYGCGHCHKAGANGTAYVSDLSGIGLKMDSDSLFAYVSSEGFTQTHSELQSIDIRYDQARYLADYLAEFKDESVSPKVTLQRTESQSEQTETSPQSESEVAVTNSPPPPPTPTEIRAMTGNLDPAQIDRGKALYKAKNCKMCHKLAGAGGSTGPKLDKVGTRRDKDWLFHHFKDPKAIMPGTRMPNFKFSDEDAQALTTYMQTLR